MRPVKGCSPESPLLCAYWGTYSIDSATNRIVLRPEGGNHLPADFDGEGTFDVDRDGGLILRGVWLGTPRNESVMTGTGHWFETLHK